MGEFVVAQGDGVVGKRIHRRHHRMRFLAAQPPFPHGRALQKIAIVEQQAVRRVLPRLMDQACDTGQSAMG